MNVGLSVIIHAILTSRCIFQRMKNYTIYAVSITIRIVVGFLLVALMWQFDFSPFMVLIIAILNDGTIMTISKVWINFKWFRKSSFFSHFFWILTYNSVNLSNIKTILWTFYVFINNLLEHNTLLFKKKIVRSIWFLSNIKLLKWCRTL